MHTQQSKQSKISKPKTLVELKSNYNKSKNKSLEKLNLFINSLDIKGEQTKRIRRKKKGDFSKKNLIISAPPGNIPLKLCRKTKWKAKFNTVLLKKIFFNKKTLNFFAKF